MLFNTLQFWLFFALVLGAYAALFALGTRARRAQNVLLLAASYLFYAGWDWRFLGLLVVSTSADWLLARAIAREATQAGARRWVALSVTLNLLFLGFFKYFNFFVESAAALLRAVGLPGLDAHLHVILPVGISFYTFQSMSYIVDVYRREIAPADDPLDFALFVAFFPHMVAGPIMHSRDLLPQMQQARRLRWDEMQSGFHLALWGLFKKVVVADNLATIANPIFAREHGFGPGVVHLGALCFAFQIYCDFSGYTDVARGVARIMGFRLMDNFHHPYFATCVTDFWRRWHISLSTWLRDYLYVPLGGNRGTPARTYRNLGLTMLLGGLWHGAAWNFVLWGAYQGLLLVAERLVGGRRLVVDLRDLSTWPARLLGVARVLATFHFVCLGWIFFRAEGLRPLLRMASAYVDPSGWLLLPASLAWTAAPYIAIVVLVDLLQFFSRDELVLLRPPAIVRGFIYAAGAYAFILFGRFESNAFIYFQF